MRNEPRQIVITGLGAVSPFGLGLETFWSSLVDGRDALRQIDRWDIEPYRFKEGGQVPFGDDDLGRPQMDLATRFALWAVDEAAAQAGLGELPPSVDTLRCGVIGATNFGGMTTGEKLIGEVLVKDGEFDRAAYVEAFGSTVTDRIAEGYGLHGPRLTVSLSCASGNAALDTAWRMIRAGQMDLAVVVGYDALNEFCWSGLSALRTMTTDKLRPFDAERKGTLFSEGAGALVVESAEGAKARGAAALARLCAAATDNNAFHMTAPDKDGFGQIWAVRRALAEAGIDPSEVDHVNMHGTGTKYNDSTETDVFKQVLGQRAHAIPFTSIKSTIGHTMGAASALEAIASIMTIRTGTVPPTINYRTPDPECDLDYCTDGPRRGTFRTVISNSSGIGGCNSVVVLQESDDKEVDHE